MVRYRKPTQLSDNIIDRRQTARFAGIAARGQRRQRQADLKAEVESQIKKQIEDVIRRRGPR